MPVSSALTAPLVAKLIVAVSDVPKNGMLPVGFISVYDAAAMSTLVFGVPALFAIVQPVAPHNGVVLTMPPPLARV